MERVAKELATFGDGAKKTAVAVGIFGKAGADLIPFLKALEEQGTKNSKLTQQQIEDADNYVKSLAGLRSEFNDLSRVIATSAIPTLTKYASLTKELFGGDKSRYTLETEIGLLKSNLAKLQDIGPGFSVFGFFGSEESRATEIASIEKQLSEARKKFYALTAVPGDQNPNESRRFGMLPREINYEPDKKTPKIGKSPRPGVEGIPIDRMEAFRQSELELQALVNQTLATDKLSVAEEIRGDSLKKLANQQAEFNALLAGTATAALEKAREQIDLLQDALSKTTDPKQAQKIREAIGALAETAGLFPTLVEDTKKLDSLGKDLGLTFSSAFEDALVDGGKLGDILKGLEKDIVRIIARKSITEPLGDAIGGLFKTSGSGGSGGNIFASAFSAIGSLFAGGFADGGYIPPGHWGMTGERGPEPVFGGKTGVTVQPSGRAVNVVNNFTINGPTTRDSQGQIAAAAADALRRAHARHR